MRYKLAAVIVSFCASQLCNAQTTAVPSEQPSPKNGICLFTGTPPSEFTYTVLKELDYGKGTFGSVNDILPKVVEDARAAGADAVIHYNGAQHFGFWPWRFVHPVVTGTAVKWSPARDVDCAGAGGYYTTGRLDAAPPAPPKK
jgi:hypothetical protein